MDDPLFFVEELINGLAEDFLVFLSENAQAIQSHQK
jgi:hypothetical protein